MNKKQKYYKFIIDDMISKTEVDYDTWGGTSVVFPYFPEDNYYSDTIEKLKYHDSYVNDFSYYMSSRYGVIEDEMGMLYQIYLDGVIDKVRSK